MAAFAEIPTRDLIPYVGWSWTNVGSMVPETRYYERTPWCSPHWTCGCTLDYGPHQASFLVERVVGRRQTIRVILSDVSAHEVRPQEKGGFIAANPLPERKWQQITTDLVIDLRKSEGMTAITVFVDRLSKMVHFVACKKDITTQ